jgi:hypothetical protein
VSGLACLVLGYGAATVLAKSAPILVEAGFDLYLHVDKKVDIKTYVEELGNAAHLCNILKDRIEIFWGGFSMVRAEILLIEKARAQVDYDKYLLISDDTFPVFPASHLARLFESSDDQITIRTQGPESHFYQRYHGLFCYDHRATTVRTPPASHPLLPIREIDADLEVALSDISFLRRAGKKNIVVFHGPQFCALSRNTVALIIRTAENDIHFVKSFEYSALPDEMFFHSIIGNYGEKEFAETAPVYSDFSGGGPRVVHSFDKIPRDLNPPHAFIRKILPTATELLNVMSEHLLRGLTIYGAPPDEPLSAVSWIKVGDNKICRIRLCAPDGSARAEGWHDIEIGWGRKFRWTAKSRVAWEVEIPPLDAATIQFFLATAISPAKNWVTDCKIAVGGVERPAVNSGGELSADFTGVHPGRVTVELLTPEPRVPAPDYPDTRHLGLAVSV